MLTTNTISVRCKHLWCRGKDPTGPIGAQIGDLINAEFLAPVHGWAFEQGKYEDHHHPHYDYLQFYAPQLFCVYVHCVQSERNGLTWYAFSTLQEKEMFLLLITVDGVGPKSALDILARTKGATIQELIDAGDRESFKKLPKVGPKTGDKLITVLFKKAPPQPMLVAKKTILNEGIVSGLMSLGYHKKEAAPVVLALQEELGPDVEESVLLRKAIQKLSKK